MRALGIDFGERRIGLAISDPAGRLALPLATIERETDRKAIGRIAEIAGREGVARLVVGEPVGLDGERGPAARRARGFAARLAERTGLPCELVDEALTSVAARERLAEPLSLAGFWLWRLRQPYKGYAEAAREVSVDPGSKAVTVLARLEGQGVIANAGLARVYLVYVLHNPPIQAGDYRFEGQLTTS